MSCIPQIDWTNCRPDTVRWFLDYHLTFEFLFFINLVIQICALIRSQVQERFSIYIMMQSLACIMEISYHIMMCNRDIPNDTYIWVSKYVLSEYSITIISIVLWYWTNKIYGSNTRLRFFIVIAVIISLVTIISTIGIISRDLYLIFFRILIGTNIIYSIMLVLFYNYLKIIHNHAYRLLHGIISMIALTIFLVLNLYAIFDLSTIVDEPYKWFLYDGTVRLIALVTSAIIAINRFLDREDAMLQ